MAVLANDTVRSDITEAVPAERLEASLQQPNLPEPVFTRICWGEAVPAGVGSTCNLLSVSDETVPSGTKTEGDEFAGVTFDTAEVTITGGVVGYARFISYEAINDAAIDVIGQSSALAVRKIVDRLDADGFVLNDSLTTNETHAGAATLDEHILSALTKFMLLDADPGLSLALVLHPKQIGDWTKDLSQSGGAYLGGDAASAATASMIGPHAGFKGVRHGCQVYVSNNCPVAAGDATGCLVPMGMFSPLAMRSWRPLTVQMEDVPLRQQVRLVYAIRYGVGLANSNGVKIITDGA
jgi:hypothetical protein